MTLCLHCGDRIGGGEGGYYSLVTTFETCSASPTTFHEAGAPWVWNPRQRAFSLPRQLRLPKRPRRLARQKLREDA